MKLTITPPPPKKNKITKLVTMKGGWKMNTDELLSSPEQPSLGWVGLIGEKVLRPNLWRINILRKGENHEASCRGQSMQLTGLAWPTI